MLTSSIHHHTSPRLSVAVVHTAVADPKYAASSVHVLRLSGRDAVPLTVFNSAGRLLAKQTSVHPDDADVQGIGLAERV